MRFKVDENLPTEVVDDFGDRGHDATTVVAEGLKGATDERLIDICHSEGRILITLDVGFANVSAYPPASTPGIIVLRLARQDKPSVLGIINAILTELDTRSPEGQLWVVEEGRIRIRE